MFLFLSLCLLGSQTGGWRGVRRHRLKKLIKFLILNVAIPVSTVEMRARKAAIVTEQIIKLSLLHLFQCFHIFICTEIMTSQRRKSQ